MPKNLILWLEDRPKSCEKFRKYCKDYGFEVKMVATDHQFLGFLEQNLDGICLIIVDLMIFGISDLSNIGLENSDTLAGYNAGWVIIERLLRSGEGEKTFGHIPVVVLTSRTATEADIYRLEALRRWGGDILYFEKFGLTPGGRLWENEFQELINRIKKN